MKDTRPVNLDLGSLKFPMMAIVSILHRISGVIVFLLIPVLLFLLQTSLQSAAGFHQVTALFSCWLLRLVVWGFLVAIGYHIIAGIRHMLMDAGIGHSLVGGRRGAIIVFVLAALLTIVTGVWLWL